MYMGDYGGEWEEGGGKERILKGKENGSTLHIYMRRQLNETRNTVWKREERDKWEWEYNGGVNLFKVLCTRVWNYHSQISADYQCIINKKK